MKKINVYEVITGLKRDLVMDDFLALPAPKEAANFPEVFVKVFTENIYLPEIGCYVLVVWDFTKSKPAIMVLNHTLFAALKRWRSDAMQDVISKTFTILSKSNNEGVVYHDIYCRGLLPLLTDEVIDEVDEYINNLFDIKEAEVEENE